MTIFVSCNDNAKVDGRAPTHPRLLAFQAGATPATPELHVDERVRHLIARLEAHLGRPLTAEERHLLILSLPNEPSEEEPPDAEETERPA